MISVDSSRGSRVCRRITRHHARTFYLASRCLPREVRAHAFAVYGFCRWADDGVDCADGVEDAARRLDHARESLDRACGRGVLPPGLSEFRRTIRARGIPIRHFYDLLDGMAMDLSISRYDDFAALDVYCYRVAGVVGLMMAHVFGYTHERCLPHAVSLGKAMQMTNILRDVREDFDRGRIYLPADEMRRFGVSESHVAEGRFDEGFRELVAFQIARARTYYEAAERGIPDLVGASCRMTVRVMGRLYGGILAEIERTGGNVLLGRAHVPLRRKLRMLGSCQVDTWREQLGRAWC